MKIGEGHVPQKDIRLVVDSCFYRPLITFDVSAIIEGSCNKERLYHFLIVKDSDLGRFQYCFNLKAWVTGPSFDSGFYRSYLASLICSLSLRFGLSMVSLE